VCGVLDFLAMACAGKDEVFEVRGYVVAVSPRCPPCPPRVNCTPCPPTFIVLSSTPDPDDLKVPGSGNLRVAVPTTAPFPIGEQVTVKVVMGEIGFRGDPCCTPRPYFVQSVP
jgi:hypothetical protein